jgi:hypothetical protein
MTQEGIIREEVHEEVVEAEASETITSRMIIKL